MATCAFQGNAFQLYPTAFQDVQTISASGTLGITDGFSGQYGLAKLAAVSLGIIVGQNHTAKATTQRAGISVGLKGALSASSGNVLRASISLGTKEDMSRSSVVVHGVSTTLAAVIDGISASARGTEGAVTSIGAKFTTALSSWTTIHAATTLSQIEGLTNRQQFIRPVLIAGTTRLNFQHRIGHRGSGGIARAKHAAGRVEPAKRPPTFADFLEGWQPPPFELPAPHLVRVPGRDLRPAPKPRPLVTDVMAIDRAISDALDHRDAFAMLEALLHTEQVAREAQDERDVMDLLSQL